MKKSLLLSACFALAVSASAQNAEPVIYPGYVITGISANGVWAASSDDNYNNFAVINLSTGQTWDYATDGMGDSYSGGNGKYVSDNGVVVGNTTITGLPCYWEGGEWHTLPMKEDDYAGYPNAITPDGSMIVGSVAKAAMSLEEITMNVPVAWFRNADGTYGDYVALPCPSKDWSGRLPQYVQAVDVSADGNVVALGITDYSGMIQEPAVAMKVSDTEWEYVAIHPELLNPEGIELPPYPGECPEEPQMTDFMSPEELAAYNAALEEYWNRPYPEAENYMTPEELEDYLAAVDAYYEDWENNPFPEYQDYMTEEEWDEYQAALNDFESDPGPQAEDYMTEEELAAYNEAVEGWETKFEEWIGPFSDYEEALYMVLENPDAVKFSMNSCRISANGNYYVMTAEKLYEDPTSMFGYSQMDVPYVFDLNTDAIAILDKGVNNVYATVVLDNGGVVGGAPADRYDRSAVIAQSFEAPFVSIASLAQEKDATLYTWMKEYMNHVVVDWEGNPIRQEIITGTPVCTPDLSMMASWTFNSWAIDEDAAPFYSYSLPTSALSSLKSALADKSGKLTVALAAGGVLTVSGDATSVAVYDINGRCVYSAGAISGTTNTGLKAGAYLVKAVAADGTAVVTKAII